MEFTCIKECSFVPTYLHDCRTQEMTRQPSRIAYRGAGSIHVPSLITWSAQVWSSKLTVPRKGTREGVEKAAAAWAEQLVFNSETGNFKQLLRHLVQMLARCTSGDIGKGTGEADAADLPAGISSKSLVLKREPYATLRSSPFISCHMRVCVRHPEGSLILLLVVMCEWIWEGSFLLIVICKCVWRQWEGSLLVFVSRATI